MPVEISMFFIAAYCLSRGARHDAAGRMDHDSGCYAGPGLRFHLQLLADDFWPVPGTSQAYFSRDAAHSALLWTFCE